MKNKHLVFSLLKLYTLFIQTFTVHTNVYSTFKFSQFDKTGFLGICNRGQCNEAIADKLYYLRTHPGAVTGNPTSDSVRSQVQHPIN